MELNLRKARKLEAKIYNYVEKMSLKPSVKVRVQADEETRLEAITKGREKFLEEYELQKNLYKVRFDIRKKISDANQNIGINELINKRELFTALLGKVPATEAVDLAEVDDKVESRRTILEKGQDHYGSNDVTLLIEVANQEDIDDFKKESDTLKRNLEDIEDTLSQKNMGGKITLEDETVKILQQVGLL